MQSGGAVQIGVIDFQASTDVCSVATVAPAYVSIDASTLIGNMATDYGGAVAVQSGNLAISVRPLAFEDTLQVLIISDLARAWRGCLFHFHPCLPLASHSSPESVAVISPMQPCANEFGSV